MGIITRHFNLLFIGLTLLNFDGRAADQNGKPFRIQVVDAATSRGIPLLILESSLNTRHVTDSNGLIAYDDPIAMGKDVFFKPISDGYSYQAPGLAMGGTVLKPQPGSSTTIIMKRDMIAERLYRITGAGIYRDTMALGENSPISHPLLNAGVAGQDSALCTPFDGKLFWIWGDTGKLGHPLAANFRATAAFSEFPQPGGLSIDRGVNLNYITNNDFVMPMMPLRHGQNSEVYWLSCLMTVPDRNGKERILAWWNRIENPNMKTAERGMAEFDAGALEFKPITTHPTTAPLQPSGHAVRHGDYFYFVDYGKLTRVKASYEAAKDPSQYEAYTCLENEGAFTTATARIARQSDGKIRYEWRKATEGTGATEQRQLLEAGLLKPEECYFRPVDVKTGKPFLPHACHIAWNSYLQKWTMITSEIMGSSMLGEIWYLESDRIEGPWTKAVKVLTHEQYSFYNPLQHPELAPVDSHYLYFEGTYTKSFSAAPVATPYYDYNQIMYRIDLDHQDLQKLRQ